MFHLHEESKEVIILKTETRMMVAGEGEEGGLQVGICKMKNSRDLLHNSLHIINTPVLCTYKWLR